MLEKERRRSSKKRSGNFRVPKLNKEMRSFCGGLIKFGNKRESLFGTSAGYLHEFKAIPNKSNSDSDPPALITIKTWILHRAT